LTKRVFNTSFKSALLLLLPDFHPISDKNDSAVYYLLFGYRTELQKLPMLFLGAETHYVFHASAVVPASVENHYLSSG
jgi:hypothetical protein